MLSVAALSGGQERYYLDLAREDYYLQGGEPPGTWHGKGAERLQLHGTVERHALTQVLRGLHPGGGEPLGQVQRYGDGRERQPGWDLTFSAPKSVSTLWSQLDGDLRLAIESAQKKAVSRALDYIQEVAGWSRRGKGGQQVERAELAFALFDHGTSRAQDPQLHTHVLVPNAGRREDETWGSIRSRDLYQHKMSAGALYRAELAYQLAQLGLELQAGKYGFRLRGVPKELDDTFSQRRAAIEEELGRLGLGSARAAELVAKKTREAKNQFPREELSNHWRAVGKEMGFSSAKACQLFSARPRPRTEAQERRAIERACAKATAEHTERGSTFRERDMLAAVGRTLEAKGFSLDQLLEGVRNYLGTSDSIVRLDPELTERSTATGGGKASAATATPLGGEYPLFTTRSLYEVEKRLLQQAQRGRGALGYLVDRPLAAKVLKSHRGLNAEQRRAFIHLTRNAGDIVCLSGMAGTGKTRLLRAAREAWREQGLDVLGCALSADAAAELDAGAGIKSCTIKSFFVRYDASLGQKVKQRLSHDARQLVRAARKRKTWRLKTPKLSARTVLVVDEASMVGTRDMGQLISRVRRAGGKVVLVGDAQQLQAIEAGAPFRKLTELLGAARLTKIRRQQAPWMQQAVQDFAAGDARSGLGAYASRGFLAIGQTKQKAIEKLVADWFRHRPADLSESLILAGTRADVAALNQEVRDSRLRRGELGSKVMARIGEQEYSVGDRVVFTKNMRRQGFLNGDFGTIEEIRRRGLRGTFEITVRLDRTKSEGSLELPQRVTVTLTKDTPLMLGYATSTHKAQGATVQCSFVLAGGLMQDRELSYVQMSRHREQCRVYCSEAEVGEDLAELVSAMEKSRQKDAVFDHAQDLQHALERERVRIR